MLDDAGLRKAFDAFAALRPTHVWTLGADTIDGHSDPNFSLRLVALADLGARLGATARVLGFSFSASPHPGMRDVYEAVHPGVAFHVRDPRSFARFEAFCDASARPVADTAFLLEPDSEASETAEARRWIDVRRRAGDGVVAFNFHPLLLPLARRHELPGTLERVAAELQAFAASRDVSIALVAHDFRGAASDRHCHAPLFEAVSVRRPERWLDLSGPLHARALKGLVGRFDAVVSGRMHLSIASLGMGTPVLAFDYNDKASGLMELFGLDEGHVTGASELLDEGRLADRMRALLDAAPASRTRIEARLGDVFEKARANFA